MKFLFDQNISFRIISRIQDLFPQSEHVKEFSLTDKSDHFIWQFAKQNDFTIITFDSDFIDIATLKGTPPKIIWLRMGNTTTAGIETILRKNHLLILDFLENEKEATCLELFGE
jgi:predicted nuclease of predicted toxin-antitoxin system